MLSNECCWYVLRFTRRKLWLSTLDPTLSVHICARGNCRIYFIGFLAVGGSPIAAAIAGLLVNLRHLPFGIAVNELIRGKFSQYFGSHIMNDESVLFGMAQPDFETKRLLTGYVV